MKLVTSSFKTINTPSPQPRRVQFFKESGYAGKVECKKLFKWLVVAKLIPLSLKILAAMSPETGAIFA